MRIDSCRKCGKEMQMKQICFNCRNPIKFTCKSCHAETEEQIHLDCMLIVSDNSLLAAKVA